MTQDTAAPQQQQKTVLHANQIIEAMSKLFGALEQKHIITEANLRGALSTMLCELNK